MSTVAADHAEVLLPIKKLIVCCDGTWMTSDGGKNHIPSNVTRLARAIKSVDSESYPQIVYYQAGIGTGLGVLNQFIGGGTGLGFSENVREAYAFLANNYHSRKLDRAASDRIFLLGFSRGAYTARSLGGLIGQLGLLNKRDMYWFYDIFEDWQNAGNPSYTPQFWAKWSALNEKMGLSARYSVKRPHGKPEVVDDYLAEYRDSLLSFGLTREAYIEAIGVYDTVGALGVPVNPILQKIFNLRPFLHSYKWVNTELSDRVKNAYQALALDEHRSPFYPSVWERRDSCPTKLKQVWFAGPHSSVGGAYSDFAQANITLAWMMDQLSGWELKRDKVAEWASMDWLEFDITYLEEQCQLNINDQKGSGGERSWALGTIYNSLTFPQIFAGSRTRRPGRTHPTNYVSGRQDKGRLLWNTNEQVHASVRTRIMRAGPDFERDPDANLVNRILSQVIAVSKKVLHEITGRKAAPYYHPQKDGPLKDWELRDGREHHDEHTFDMVQSTEQDAGHPPYWEYVGDDPMLKAGATMGEDRLGYHEIILLRGYPDISNWVQASNVGMKKVNELPDPKRDSVRHSVTM